MNESLFPWFTFYFQWMDEVLLRQQSHLTQIILDSLTQMFNEKKDKKLHHFEIQNPTNVSLMKTGDLSLTFSSRRAAAQFCNAVY